MKMNKRNLTIRRMSVTFPRIIIMRKMDTSKLRERYLILTQALMGKRTPFDHTDHMIFFIIMIIFWKYLPFDSTFFMKIPFFY